MTMFRVKICVTHGMIWCGYFSLSIWHSKHAFNLFLKILPWMKYILNSFRGPQCTLWPRAVQYITPPFSSSSCLNNRICIGWYIRSSALWQSYNETAAKPILCHVGLYVKARNLAPQSINTPDASYTAKISVLKMRTKIACLLPNF